MVYLYNKLVSNSLYQSTISLVKDGVAFIKFRVALYTERGFFITYSLSGSPFLFLEQRRDPSSTEMDQIGLITGIVEKGVESGLSESVITQVVNSSLDMNISHSELLYVIKLSVNNKRLKLEDIPVHLRPEAEPVQYLPLPMPKETSTGVQRGYNEIDLTTFVGNNIVPIVIVVVTAAIIYYYWRGRPGTPSSSASGSGSDTSSNKGVFVKPNNTVKYIIMVYAFWILFVRVFFIKKGLLLISILVTVMYMNLYLKVFPMHDWTSVTSFFLPLGINHGCVISSHTLSHRSNLFDGFIPFLNETTDYVIANYKSASMSAVSSTRVVLLVGAFNDTCHLINGHLDRIDNHSKELISLESVQKTI